MESEEDAKDTIMDLKLKKRSFNGTPVKARLKTDPGLRSYYTAPGPVLPIAYPGMTFQPYGMVMDTQGAAPFSYDSVSATSPSSPQSKDKSGAAGDRSYRKEGSEGDDSGRRDGRERVSADSTFHLTLHIRERGTIPRGTIALVDPALTVNKAAMARDLGVVIAKRTLLLLLPQQLRLIPQQTFLLSLPQATLPIKIIPHYPQVSLVS